MSLIFCACGCGQQREEFDSQKRKRLYVKGHDKRGTHRSDTTKLKISIGHTGKHDSLETRKLKSEKLMGNTWMIGKHPSTETRIKLHDNHPRLGLFGEDNPLWKGGKKVWKAKVAARRKGYGFIPINECREDGWVGHHIDNDYVIFIPAELHKSIPHTQKNQDSMDRINDAVYDWFTKEYLKE